MKKLFSIFLFSAAISSVFAWEGKFVKEGDVSGAYVVISKNDNSLCLIPFGLVELSYGIFSSGKMCVHSIDLNDLHLDSEQSICETIEVMQDHDYTYVE